MEIPQAQERTSISPAWDLSRDQIAKVHAGEMIIPPAQAAGMRNFFETVSNDNAPGRSGSGGGDTHNHTWQYHDHTGTVTPDRIYANKAALAKAVTQAHREGHFAGFKGFGLR